MDLRRGGATSGGAEHASRQLFTHRAAPSRRTAVRSARSAHDSAGRHALPPQGGVLRPRRRRGRRRRRDRRRVQGARDEVASRPEQGQCRGGDGAVCGAVGGARPAARSAAAAAAARRADGRGRPGRGGGRAASCAARVRQIHRRDRRAAERQPRRSGDALRAAPAVGGTARNASWCCRIRKDKYNCICGCASRRTTRRAGCAAARRGASARASSGRCSASSSRSVRLQAPGEGPRRAGAVALHAPRLLLRRLPQPLPVQLRPRPRRARDAVRPKVLHAAVPRVGGERAARRDGGARASSAHANRRSASSLCGEPSRRARRARRAGRRCSASSSSTARRRRAIG